MGNEEIKNFLKANKGYLKWGRAKLAEKFGTTKKNVQNILDEVKEELSPENFRRMFFDIETSPNIIAHWRTGYKERITPDQILKERAIICICWKWEGEDKVYSLTWDKNQCDKEMLKEFSKVVQEADELVAHNGDRFDVKWLRTRCLYHRIPFNTYIKTLDTLKKAKSGFNFNSNKLDYIAKFLKVGGKIETGGFDLWLDIMINKSEKALQKMVDYCKNDVIIMEDVFKELSTYIKPNTHVGVFRGGEKHSCPNCGSTDISLIKNVVTPKGAIQRHMECSDCGADHILSNTGYKKFKEALKEENDN